MFFDLKRNVKSPAKSPARFLSKNRLKKNSEAKNKNSADKNLKPENS